MVGFPDIPPTFNTAMTKQPRTRVNEFGNGYSQRVGDGLNTIREQWQVVWEGISWTDCQAIDTFLSARSGAQAFTWAPPGEDEKQYFCPNWSKVKTSGNTGNVSAQFIQVFDL